MLEKSFQNRNLTWLQMTPYLLNTNHTQHTYITRLEGSQQMWKHTSHWQSKKIASMQKLNHTRHSLLNVDLQIEKNINYICLLEKLLRVINASRFAKWKIEIITIEYFVTFMANGLQHHLWHMLFLLFVFKTTNY